jgi:hypothetical protein
VLEEVAIFVGVIVRRYYLTALALAPSAVAFRSTGEFVPSATLTISCEVVRVSAAPGVTL